MFAWFCLWYVISSSMWFLTLVNDNFCLSINIRTTQHFDTLTKPFRTRASYYAFVIYSNSFVSFLVIFTINNGRVLFNGRTRWDSSGLQSFRLQSRTTRSGLIEFDQPKRTQLMQASINVFVGMLAAFNDKLKGRGGRSEGIITYKYKIHHNKNVS